MKFGKPVALREGRVRRRVEGIVGRENFHADEEHRIAYSYDALNREVVPAAVAFPRSALEVSDVLRAAAEEGFPVIPRGAGSGRAGGSLPVPEGLVLSLERMSTIHRVDADNLTAEVDPGVVTGELHRAVESEGLFYPPDPASQSFCTVGGNVATNAGGLRTIKYGVTRDYVLRLEAVLPGGKIFHTGRETRKSVAGYDLTRLLVGSEGTLAVVTRVVVKLLPLPEGKRTLQAFFPDVSGAGDAVRAVLKAGYVPTTLEFLDGGSLTILAESGKLTIPPGAGAMILVEDDGNESALAASMEKIREILSREGAGEVRVAEDAAQAESLWQARRLLSPTLAKRYPHRISEDVAVPLQRIADLLRATEEICRRHGIGNANFGHAGDGNIHLNLLFNAEDPGEVRAAEAAVEDILRAVVGMKGTISGEHGIGTAKRPYLGLEVLEPAMGLMRKIKQAFDPKGILNPGKILP